MRIISGKYKGKKMEGYNIDGTRPTMDRVKESLFATIQNKIKNSVCLDLFAGSGSLGIEALSNGASKCIFADNNPQVIKILKQNIKLIDAEGATVLRGDYLQILQNLYNEKIKLDVIFLDPPYHLHLINSSLEKIKKFNLLNDDGIIICEYEDEFFNDSYFNLIKEKKYGSKVIKIYKKGA